MPPVLANLTTWTVATSAIAATVVASVATPTVRINTTTIAVSAIALLGTAMATVMPPFVWPASRAAVADVGVEGTAATAARVTATSCGVSRRGEVVDLGVLLLDGLAGEKQGIELGETKRLARRTENRQGRLQRRELGTKADDDEVDQLVIGNRTADHG